MRIWREWQAERALRRRAASYIRTLQAEPSDADVAWLSARATRGDDDHARWELRYARRALGLLAARRDALDDRTASAVAHELASSLQRDPNVAAPKLHVAERQLNARLRAYGDALGSREASRSVRARLGAALLAFAGPAGPANDADVERAGELLARYLAEANEALRHEFGVATLPEDVPPSAVAAARTP